MGTLPNPLLDPNPTIDGQHRFQVELINELNNAVGAGKPYEEISRILSQLTAHSKAHFAFEEHLMRQDSYNRLQNHVEEHEAMMQILNDMTQNFHDGKLNLLPGQVQTALAFLLKHINTSDRLYVTKSRTGSTD
jgi:hemerythrin-like metal-binding protein